MSGAIGTDRTGPPTGGNQFTLRTDDLDESFYYLDEAEQGFLSNQTGIKEPEDLRRYVLQIQKEAYAVSTIDLVYHGEDGINHANYNIFGRLCYISTRQIHPYPCIRIFAFVK